MEDEEEPKYRSRLAARKAASYSDVKKMDSPS